MAEMVPAVLNGKFSIVLPKHRADRPEWYTEKGWEKKRLESMHQYLMEGDTIFYVGSEEGEMPALCQMWGAEVVMFEPNDKVWPNTKVIWDANKLDPPLACFSGFASNRTSSKAPLILGGFPESANGEVIHDHGFKEVEDQEVMPEWTLKGLSGKSCRELNKRCGSINLRFGYLFIQNSCLENMKNILTRLGVG
jgi:hypothetical protein